MTASFDGIAPLPHLGVIRAEGEDAVKFLHGQLTHDFALLDVQHASLVTLQLRLPESQASAFMQRINDQGQGRVGWPASPD